MTTQLFPSLRKTTQSGPTWYSQTWWGGDSLSTRQYSLLRLLAVSHRERLDLVPLITSMALEHRGYYRHLLSNLAARIEAGASLVSALEQTPDALSDEDVLALRLAGESGTWKQTFEELLKLRLDDLKASRLRPRVSPMYWLVVSFFSLLMLLLIMNVVVPTFKHLGAEMKAETPRSYLLLVRFIDNSNLGWLMLMCSIVVLWLTWFRAPRRFLQRRVAPTLLPPVAQRQIVELYRMLAIAVEAGRPVSGAISTLARYHFNRTLRQRLLFARNEIEQGSEVWQGLARTRLIDSREADALSGAADHRVTAWTLRELAYKHFLKTSRRTAALATLIEPALTLLFGGLVLWICVVFFQYLVAFINSIQG